MDMMLLDKVSKTFFNYNRNMRIYSRIGIRILCGYFIDSLEQRSLFVNYF